MYPQTSLKSRYLQALAQANPDNQDVQKYVFESTLADIDQQEQEAAQRGQLENYIRMLGGGQTTLNTAALPMQVDPNAGQEQMLGQRERPQDARGGLSVLGDVFSGLTDPFVKSVGLLGYGTTQAGDSAYSALTGREGQTSLSKPMGYTQEEWDAVIAGGPLEVAKQYGSNVGQSVLALGGIGGIGGAAGAALGSASSGVRGLGNAIRTNAALGGIGGGLAGLGQEGSGLGEVIGGAAMGGVAGGILGGGLAGLNRVANRGDAISRGLSMTRDTGEGAPVINSLKNEIESLDRLPRTAQGLNRLKEIRTQIANTDPTQLSQVDLPIMGYEGDLASGAGPEVRTSVLKDLGVKLENGTLGFKATGARSGLNDPYDAANLTDEVAQILRDNGQKLGGSYKNSQAVNDTIESLNTRIDDELDKVTTTWGSEDLISRISQLPDVQAYPELINEGKIKNIISTIRNGAGNKQGLILDPTGIPQARLNAQDMRKVRQMADGAIKRTSVEGTPRDIAYQDALNAIADEIRDDISTASPTVAELNRQISPLIKIKKGGLLGRMAQQQEGRLAFASDKMNALSSIAPEARGNLQAALGRGLQNIGNRTTGLNGVSVNMDPRLQSALRGATMPASVGLGGAAGANATQPYSPSSEGVLGLASPGMGLGQSTGLGANSKNEALMQALMLSNGDLGQAIQLANFLAPAGSGKVSKDQANAESGLRSLQSFVNIMTSDGGALGLSALPFGLGNANAQTLDVASNNIKDVIGRLRSGGAITEDEEKRYKKMIPKITDSDQARQEKVATLESLFNSLYSQ